MTDAVKVFTPIKRVPTMIGKAPNGQRIPFGPYTLPQVAGGSAVMLAASVGALSLPVNPALTFLLGMAAAGLTVFGLGLVPYTGVRLLSRVLWITRLLVLRKPTFASGVPAVEDSAEKTVFVTDSVVVLLPDRTAIGADWTAAAMGVGER